jgi:hypothetical protein
MAFDEELEKLGGIEGLIREREARLVQLNTQVENLEKLAVEVAAKREELASIEAQLAKIKSTFQ